MGNIIAEQKIHGQFKSDESATIFAILRLVINTTLKCEQRF